MLIDGKTAFPIEDGEKLGYTKGTLINYFYSGTIDHIHTTDNQWFITEKGMEQLHARKKMPVKNSTPRLVTMDAPEPVPAPPEGNQPDHIVEVNKKVPPTPEQAVKPAEGSLYLKTEEDREIYRMIKEVAVAAGIPVGDYTMSIIRAHTQTKLAPAFSELKKLEEQKKKLLAGLVN